MGAGVNDRCEKHDELLDMKRDENGGFCYHPSYTLRGFQP